MLYVDYENRQCEHSWYSRAGLAEERDHDRIHERFRGEKECFNYELCDRCHAVRLSADECAPNGIWMLAELEAKLRVCGRHTEREIRDILHRTASRMERLARHRLRKIRGSLP